MQKLESNTKITYLFFIHVCHVLSHHASPCLPYKVWLLFINPINIQLLNRELFEYWIINFTNGLFNQRTESINHQRIHWSFNDGNAWPALTVNQNMVENYCVHLYVLCDARSFMPIRLSPEFNLDFFEEHLVKRSLSFRPP